jgi:hypothetical protein
MKIGTGETRSIKTQVCTFSGRRGLAIHPLLLLVPDVVSSFVLGDDRFFHSLSRKRSADVHIRVVRHASCSPR